MVVKTTSLLAVTALDIGYIQECASVSNGDIHLPESLTYPYTYVLCVTDVEQKMCVAFTFW